MCTQQNNIDNNNSQSLQTYKGYLHLNTCIQQLFCLTVELFQHKIQ